MNYLVRGSESKRKKVGNGCTGSCPQIRYELSDLVYFRQRISGSAEVVLRSVDLSFSSVFGGFTKKRNELHSKKSDARLSNLRSKHMLSLEVKTASSVNTAYSSVRVNKTFDRSEDVKRHMRGRANDYNFRVWNDFFWIRGHLLNFSHKISFVFPNAIVCLSNDFILELLWTSTKNVNLYIRTVVANTCNRPMSKIRP